MNATYSNYMLSLMLLLTCTDLIAYNTIPSLTHPLAYYFQADYTELIKIARTGDTEAQYRIGVLLHTGKGVPQDYEKAMRWYLMAAKMGHRGAQNQLGVMCREGHGVEKNIKLARMWFQLATTHYEDEAQTNLSRLNQLPKQRQQIFTQDKESNIIQQPIEQPAIDYTPINIEKNSLAAPQILYMVQLGVFGQLSNVERIRRTLSQHGINIINKPMKRRGKTTYLLKIGPYFSMQDAKQTASQVDALFNLQSTITKQTNNKEVMQ